MIELSFAKLFLLALVALVVLGPEKLPGAARTAGVLVRRLHAGWEDVRAEVARELAVEEVRTTAKTAAATVTAATATLASAQDEFRASVRCMHQPFIERLAVLDAPPPPAPVAPEDSRDGHA